MRNLSKILDTESGNNRIVVVSGLPRSGTSMLMQMITAGGIPALSDGVRKQDEDNPRGYFEHQLIAGLQKDHSWIGQATGKVMKVIAQLLPHLPADYSYKIVFIQRPLEEVLMSQKKMLDRIGKSGASLPEEALKRVFTEQLKKVQTWLTEQDNIDVLYVNHCDILRAPDQTANALAAFLGDELNTSEMAAAVDSSLYRNCAVPKE